MGVTCLLTDGDRGGGQAPLAPIGAQARYARTPHPSGARAPVLRTIALPVSPSPQWRYPHGPLYRASPSFYCIWESTGRRAGVRAPKNGVSEGTEYEHRRCEGAQSSRSTVLGFFLVSTISGGLRSNPASSPIGWRCMVHDPHDSQPCFRSLPSIPPLYRPAGPISYE